MPTSIASSATPRYVLMDGNCRIGPNILPLHSEIECTVIYGFSEKGFYSDFSQKSQLALTPYPLVKGYLRSYSDATSNGLHLVVLDAAGPQEIFLHAATMKVVLEAQEHQSSHVSTAYRLVFDKQANAYQVEEASV